MKVLRIVVYFIIFDTNVNGYGTSLPTPFSKGGVDEYPPAEAIASAIAGRHQKNCPAKVGGTSMLGFITEEDRRCW